MISFALFLTVVAGLYLTTIFGFSAIDFCAQFAINANHRSHHIISMSRGYNDRSRFLPRKKDPKTEVFQERTLPNLEKIFEEADAEDFVTGSLLRRRRNRNLKDFKKEQGAIPKPEYEPVPDSKRSQADISQILACLACSMKDDVDMQSIDVTKYRERFNLIDWDKFHESAQAAIEDYDSGNNRSIVYNWIFFHVKKGDIQFIDGEWMWVPRVIKKRR